MRTAPFVIMLALSASVLFTACGTTETETVEAVAAPAVSTAGMPEDFVATLKAHGGLGNWKEFRQLGYAMPRGEGHETQLVDLYDRREYIKQPVADGGDPIEMGFDGENVWVTADTTYKGNPVFYKNLMFYFYAMPWVLADPGIVYSPAEPITYDGITYPGIMVGYDDGVGFSPKDNYQGLQELQGLQGGQPLQPLHPLQPYIFSRYSFNHFRSLADKLLIPFALILSSNWSILGFFFPLNL